MTTLGCRCSCHGDMCHGSVGAKFVLASGGAEMKKTQMLGSVVGCTRFGGLLTRAVMRAYQPLKKASRVSWEIFSTKNSCRKNLCVLHVMCTE